MQQRSRGHGHARDYVVAQWKMLQQETPSDYVIATGEQHSVREFVEQAFAAVGVGIRWQGVGIEEVGIVESVGDEIGAGLAGPCETSANLIAN